MPGQESAPHKVRVNHTMKHDTRLWQHLVGRCHPTGCLSRSIASCWCWLDLRGWLIIAWSTASVRLPSQHLPCLSPQPLPRSLEPSWSATRERRRVGVRYAARQSTWPGALMQLKTPLPGASSSWSQCSAARPHWPCCAALLSA